MSSVACQRQCTVIRYAHAKIAFRMTGPPESKFKRHWNPILDASFQSKCKPFLHFTEWKTKEYGKINRMCARVWASGRLHTSTIFNAIRRFVQLFSNRTHIVFKITSLFAHSLISRAYFCVCVLQHGSWCALASRSIFLPCCVTQFHKPTIIFARIRAIVVLISSWKWRNTRRFHWNHAGKMCWKTQSNLWPLTRLVCGFQTLLIKSLDWEEGKKLWIIANLWSQLDCGECVTTEQFRLYFHCEFIIFIYSVWLISHRIDSMFFLLNCRYNGFLPQGDKGRRRSKFVLHKRPEANGVRRSRHYIVQSPQTSKAILDANQHSISYTLSRNQAVIVEYKEDSDTDMFQVNCWLFGRGKRVEEEITISVFPFEI